MTAIRASITIAALVSALAVEAQTLSQQPEVEVEYDHSRDFTLIKSYDWSKSQKPAENKANHIRLTRAIHAELEKLGLEPDTKLPAALVLYRVSTRTKIQAAGSTKHTGIDPTDMRTGFMFGPGGKQNLGTLTVEMYDGRTNALIWKASTTRELGTPDMAEKIINEAVRKVFTKYPLQKDKD